MFIYLAHARNSFEMGPNHFIDSVEQEFPKYELNISI